MTTRTAILTHRVTYHTEIVNTATSPLTNIRICLALPPPFPPYQQLIDVKPKSIGCQQASDAVGNHWLDCECYRLDGHNTCSFGFTALVRNRSVEYNLPFSTQNLSIPSQFQIYTRPEYFIESHHHMIKDLARDIAQDHGELIPFIKTAMRTVTEILHYEPQRHERGAAFAIEQKCGDCTEYAALFAALCRARGIPARLISGFASLGKNWERHGWSEVWIHNHWIPIDPTWFGKIGWLGVTNRHLPLIIGNWMDIHSNQEYKITWTQRQNISSPRVKSTWKVKLVAGLQPS
jgi:hypothetical protein